MEVHGGGNYRAIVAETINGVKVIRQLMPTDPDPTQAQLDSLAYSLSMDRDLDGVPAKTRVVKVMRPGPYSLVLDDVTYQGLAGLNDGGTVGTDPTRYNH